jgi:trehalose 6-phosphate synthase
LLRNQRSVASSRVSRRRFSRAEARRDASTQAGKIAPTPLGFTNPINQQRCSISSRRFSSIGIEERKGLPRLVIVSNRVSLPSGSQARAGGLAVAMREALQANGGLWFGWSGEVVDTLPAALRTVTRGNITYALTDLSTAEHDLYYAGYSNAALWPLLHFRLGLIEYHRNAARAYFEVNRRFAAMLAPMIAPDDLIWVQDYHLIPLGAALRAHGIANRIGFFLHTPFPPPDVVMALPRHESLIEAMCSYDLLGFQTDENRRAFLRCVTEIGGGKEQGADGFAAFGRTGRAATFPIGIDTDGFAELARRSAGSAETQRLEQSLGQRQLILGIDRLDYSKGIPQRFEAIEGLLTDWPEHRGQFTYLQITPYSRGEVSQYRTLRRQIEALAGRINGRFAEFDWSPIRYVNRSFTRASLAGFNRRARIGLVTPLRDGMNLVAKEFVAAQNPEDPGVLILSRFAGAANELDAALLVNPIDVDEMAIALRRGLAMSLGERRERWQTMMARLKSNTITTWRVNFLSALVETSPHTDVAA